MASNTLIIYHSTDGHTIKICQNIANTLLENDHTVNLISVDDFSSDLDTYDQIIIAASIRYGKHNKKITAFIEENRAILDQKDNAFVSVNLVARKPEKNQADTNPYVKKFLKSITWKPQKVYVFAGHLDYPKYGFFDRVMIQLIMYITGGPTDPTTKIEYTDWDRVRRCGEELVIKPIKDQSPAPHKLAHT
jgi:menaquinone-dependent protoporphyrinogen oxidase